MERTEGEGMRSFLKDLQDRGIEPAGSLLEKFDTDRVDKYYRFLNEFNERGGFFSRGDRDRIAERHLYESMVLAARIQEILAVSRETEMADAGSGPGLPGFLFGCLRESPGITFIDSSRRRLGLLEDFCNAEGMERLRFEYRRLEESQGKYDLIVLRALIPYPFCLELICNLQRDGGMAAIAMGDPPSEDKRSVEYLEHLGYVSRETVELEELAFLGRRTIKLLLKSGSVGSGYPRNWKRIKEQMKRWEK